ncbi:hypothetical protein V2G26_014625 [Clonostachys chloroleuca]
MPTNYGVKKRLYLSHPEPDVAVVRKSVTRFIPPERKPSPPPRIPEKIEIDVISVDVDPPTPRRKRSRSRSKRRSPRESRELERVIERDHFIPVPYPVEVEPQYDTFRYVEGPRRYEPSPSPPPPPRRAIEEDTRIRISDRERFRDRRERW